MSILQLSMKPWRFKVNQVTRKINTRHLHRHTIYKYMTSYNYMTSWRPKFVISSTIRSAISQSWSNKVTCNKFQLINILKINSNFCIYMTAIEKVFLFVTMATTINKNHYFGMFCCHGNRDLPHKCLKIHQISWFHHFQQEKRLKVIFNQK